MTYGVRIVGQYQPLRWAEQILKDWGVHVSTNRQEATGSYLVITDETHQRDVISAENSIILTGTSMSIPHIMAQSGCLVTWGQRPQEFFFPTGIVEATIANGVAILALQKLRSEIKGRQEMSVVQLVGYLGAFNISAKEVGMITGPRCSNLLEGPAPFYGVYPCKEGWLSLGNLEPKFYQSLIKALPLSEEQASFCEDAQFSQDDWPKLRQILDKTLKTRTAKQWEEHLRSSDTCVAAVVPPKAGSPRQPRLLPLKPKL